MATHPAPSPRPLESSCSDDAASGVEFELALVRDMVAGADRAWREFHRRYDRLIFRCITNVTIRFPGVVQQDDIREIYATLLLALLSNDMHKLRTFDPRRGSRLGSWIGLLAINAAYDFLRAKRREPKRVPLAAAESLCGHHASPHDDVESKERIELVQAMLRDFSEKDRQFMALYFGEGLEPEEIAQRMQISVKTVYSKKHKIQTRLEALLHQGRLAA